MNFGRPLCGHRLVFHYFILYSQCLKCQNLCYYNSYLLGENMEILAFPVLPALSDNNLGL